jgi:hypothetical protein
MSRDSGASWNSLYSDAKRCFVYKLAVTPDGSVLHAASDCGEIDFRLTGVEPVEVPGSPAIVRR